MPEIVLILVCAGVLLFSTASAEEWIPKGNLLLAGTESAEIAHPDSYGTVEMYDAADLRLSGGRITNLYLGQRAGADTATAEVGSGLVDVLLARARTSVQTGAGADIFAFGLYDNAFGRLDGGEYDYVGIYQAASATITGGTFGTLGVVESGTLIMSGGHVAKATIGTSGAVDLSGAVIDELLFTNTCSITIGGGDFGSVMVRNACDLAITAGEFGALDSIDAASIHLHGGTFGTISATDEARIMIRGERLHMDLTGLVTGFWRDGTPFSIQVADPAMVAEGNIVLAVPEPASALCACLAGALLVLKRRKPARFRA